MRSQEEEYSIKKGYFEAIEDMENIIKVMEEENYFNKEQALKVLASINNKLGKLKIEKIK
jgi:hypothetical protein